MKNKRKHKQNQHFQLKTKENLSKTNIFNKQQQKTQAKPTSSMKNQRKPEQNLNFPRKVQEKYV